MRRDPRSRSHPRLPGRRGAGHRPASRPRCSNQPPSWNLVWQDEFDGASRARPPIPPTGTPTSGEAAGETTSSSSTPRAPRTSRSTGLGHLAITARKEAYQGRAYTSARITTRGQVRAGARPLGGAHPAAVGHGHLAGLLAAGRELSPGGLAGLRRDRHHGAAGPGAGRGERQPCTRPATPAAARSPRSTSARSRRPARRRPARRSAPSTRTSTSSRSRWRPTGSGSRWTAPSTRR